MSRIPPPPAGLVKAAVLLLAICAVLYAQVSG